MTKKGLIDLSYLEETVEGDAKTRGEMLSIIDRELEVQPDRIEQAFRRQDWQRMAECCHHFKNTVMFLGNAELQHAVQRAHNFARATQKDMKAAGDDLAFIRDIAPKMRRELQAMR